MDVKRFLNATVSEQIGVREVPGLKFGLELELEGKGVGLRDVATKGWQRHEDGSLRGESIEFITNGPKTFAEINPLVDDLFKKFKEHGSELNNSLRTSTHVHLNFSDKNFKQVVNFFTLFALLEEVLQHYSGEDRCGNLFCISTREASGIVNVLRSCISKGSLAEFVGDRYKYSACNLSTLFKFGTVEVRTMRGAESAESVKDWVSINNDMYKYAVEKMTSPADLINNLSMLGAEGLMRDIFSPENYRKILATFPRMQTLHRSLMEGARTVQILAFEFDEDFKAEYIKPPKPEKPKKGEVIEGVLPRSWPGRGEPVIYRPDGRRWIVIGVRRVRNPLGWEHLEQVHDEPRIYWDAIRERFAVDYPADVYYCNWANHPELGDEGPGVPRAMPELEEDEEPDWDDEEGEDFNDDENV